MVETATNAPESTKRKGFGENYDDICEISLFQPATKVRKLDAEFPTNMVEVQQLVGYMHDDELSEKEIINAVPNVGLIRNEAFLPPTVNEERALVLYKPVYPSLKINPELIYGLKNLSFWPRKVDTPREMSGKDDQSSSSSCLAVVPWVPSHPHPAAPRTKISTSRTEPLEEPMDVETDGASMEIEDEGFRHMKQHCMIPGMPQATASTPITWR